MPQALDKGMQENVHAATECDSALQGPRSFALPKSVVDSGDVTTWMRVSLNAEDAIVIG